MKARFTSVLCLAGLLTLPAHVQAQHYPTGAEGIKGASLPPPGVYLRDYNIFYHADTLDRATPPGFQVLAYVQAPRLIWMTDQKILGATYGMDIIVPFGFQEIRVGGVGDGHFGLGDIQVEPLLLAWHYPRVDIGAGYAVWAPSGEFRPGHAELGKGYWGHMLTLGATVFLDPDKTWALSALNRYEMNHEQDKTGITPGHYLPVEWGLSKTIQKTWDVGVVGYYQGQVTSDGTPREHIVGVGPEVSVAFPKQMFFASLRYVREFAASNRPEGNTISLTLTKRF